MTECILRVGRPRLLSETAAEEDVRLTARLSRDYPSVRRVAAVVEMFLKRVEASRRPEILIVVGDWGEGKTFTYNAYIKPWCESHGALCGKVEASRVIDRFEEITSSRRGLSPAAQLLEALLSTLLGRSQPLETIASPEVWGGRLPSRIIVFIDEAEYLVSLFDDLRRSHLVPRFLEGLTQLANLSPESPQGVPEALLHRVHVVIAFSRQAFNLLQERGETSQIMGRLNRRALRVEARRLTIVESLAHLSRLIRELLGAELGEVAVPATLLNPAIHASTGLPAALERLANSIAVYTAEGCPEGTAKQVTSENALDFYDILEYSVEGATVKPLILDEYRGIETRCIDILSGALNAGEARDTCRLLLLSLLNVTREQLGDRFDIVADILGDLVYVSRVYRLEGDPIEALDRLLAITASVLEEEHYDHLLRELLGVEYERSGEKAELVYRLLLDVFAGYCPDGSICLMLPTTRALSDLLGVDERKAERLASLAKRLLDRAVEKGVASEAGEAVMVSFQHATRYVFSQELQLLSFIPRSERLDVWRSISKTSDRQKLLISLGLAPYAVALASRLLGGDVHVVSVKPDKDSGVVELTVEKRVDARVRLELDKKRSVRPPAAVRIAIVPLEALASYEESISKRKPWERPHLAIAYGIGIQPSSERLQALEDLGIAAVHVILSRSLSTRLAAIAYQARRYNLARMGEQGIVESLYRILTGSRVELNGFEPAELQRVVSRITMLIDLESLYARAKDRLEALGVLLPQRLLAGGEIVEPQRLREAALWLSHYPEMLDKPKPVTELFETILESVRRYALYGRRYGNLLGPDIESARELLARIVSLENLDIVEVRGESVRLRTRTSRYLKRLALASEPARLEDIASLFIDPAGHATQALLETAWVLGLLVKQGELYRYVSKEDAWTARNRLSETIRRVEEEYSMLARRMGYLVQAKRRGYEVTTLTGLIDEVKRRISEAEKALDYRLVEEAARLLRSAEVISRALLGVEPGSPQPPRPADGCAAESRYLQLTILADREYNRVRRLLERRLAELRDVVEGLADSLSLITSESVRIEPDVLTKLEKVLRSASSLYERELSEEEIAARVRRLWEEYRETPQHFPFYYENAKLFCYNYKLWLLRDELRAEEVLREVEEAIEALRAEASRLKAGYEEVHQLLMRIRDLYRDVAKRAESLGLILPELNAGSLSRVEPPSRTIHGDIREIVSLLRGLLERWRERNRLEGLKESLDKLDALIAQFERLNTRLSRLTLHAEKLATLARRVAEALSNTPLYSSSLMEATAKLVEALSDVVTEAKAAPARIEASVKTVEEAVKLLERRVEEAKARAERAEMLAREAEEEALKLYELVSRAARSLAERYAVIENLCELVNVGGEVAEAAKLAASLRSLASAAPATAEDALEAVLKLAEATVRLAKLGAPEELLESVKEELGLDEKSVEALRVLAEEGSASIAKLAQRLGLKPREAVEVIMRLVERGLVDLVAVPRRK